MINHMQKLTNLINKKLITLLILALSAPTFFRMLRTGIYSMQDFHLFRLFEFNKCIESLTFPCRWAPDAGLGYGEPLFNFYGQATYWIGEIFYKIGFNFIDSIKLIFILSIVGSGISMFYLSKKIWKNNYSGIISSMLYIYAPYRAVDVWVRGALPEALSFAIFPLIILAIENGSVFWFAIFTTLLVLTHNLSLFMFAPFIIVWVLYRKFWKAIPGSLVTLGLSGFYILPIIFESKFIDIQSTIQGYFDFRAHFITLYQMLIFRFWGYGGSTWGSGDGLSLSIGVLQWTIPLIIGVIIFFKKRNPNILHTTYYILFSLGWFYLFLTHNKSTFIWEELKLLAYIQFPWRFLGVATFCFTLLGGSIVSVLTKQKFAITLVIVVLAIFLNAAFFKEDIWYSVSDNYFLTGSEWDRQRTASIGDFWPNFGHDIPATPSDGKYINYFPGWIPDNHVEGLIPSDGSVFKNTPVRKIGNTLSLATLFGLIIWLTKRKWIKET